MYCEVIIDIANANVDRLFTYAVPDGMPVCPGSHVLVPFGNGDRPKEGFALSLKETADCAARIKPVLRVIEPYPILLPGQIELARWMQRSYHCLLVDALRLMIPSQLRGGRVHEKNEKTVQLAPGLDATAALASLLTKDGAPRSPKQYEILKLLSDSRLEMRRADVLAFVPNGQSALSALQKRGYLVEGGHVTFRRPDTGLAPHTPPVTLSDAQEKAVAAVDAAMTLRRGTLLLHGVTGSGKTEVYMHCIDRCLSYGRQAIMLVPEISLTPQTVGLFRDRFGDRIAVLHSRLSVGERFDEWRRIRFSKASVAVGARSAVFAPFDDIGLIIIDEEHETSYQSESTPRYHAADVAAYRTRQCGAALLLGSATPSLLSYFRAESGRYQLLRLPERVQKRPLPEVEVVDMREEFLSGNNGVFSGRLTQLIGECLHGGHQAILFLNRRGYSTFVSCRACGYVVACDDCDVSMTYHKAEGCLKCHYCGAVKPLPRTCPNCGKTFIKYFGVGTEQVEEQLLSLFPGTKTLRMDTDTIRQKGAMQQMLASFSAGDAAVLIGTQMVAKGHDFPNVTLVGVIAADSTLCIPDYRSTERTFQLLTQVAGRAGRDESPGRVVVQTYSPAHPAIRFAKTQDYERFYAYEIAERKKALFPPYTLFLRVLFSGTDEAALEAAGQRYAALLREALDAIPLAGGAGQTDLLLYCASFAPIRRKQGLYRYQILCKLLRTARTADILKTVYAFSEAHRNDLFAMIEINPQDMF